MVYRMSLSEGHVDLVVIETELKRPFHRLRFTHRLELAFEAEAQPERNRLLRGYLIVRGVLMLLLFWSHVQLAPSMQLWLVWLIIGPALLTMSGVAFLRRQCPVWLQGVAVVLPSIVDTVSGALVGLSTPEPETDRVLMGVGFLIFVVATIVPLRFRHAAICCAGSVVGYDTVLLGGFGPPPSDQSMPVLTVTILASIGLVLAFRQERAARKAYLLQTQGLLLITQLSRLSNTDPLTGLWNRRYFEESIARVWESTGGRERFALVMIDIDRFKLINDLLGHVEGDLCLKAVAQCLRSELRDDEELARYGGEEFAVLLRNIEYGMAKAAAERLRRAVEEAAIPHPTGSVVTVSVGLAHSGWTGSSSALELVQAADSALYQAKRAGRNRTIAEQVKAPKTRRVA